MRAWFIEPWEFCSYIGDQQLYFLQTILSKVLGLKGGFQDHKLAYWTTKAVWIGQTIFQILWRFSYFTLAGDPAAVTRAISHSILIKWSKLRFLGSMSLTVPPVGDVDTSKKGQHKGHSQKAWQNPEEILKNFYISVVNHQQNTRWAIWFWH